MTESGMQNGNSKKTPLTLCPRSALPWFVSQAGEPLAMWKKYDLLHQYRQKGWDVSHSEGRQRRLCHILWGRGLLDWRSSNYILAQQWLSFRPWERSEVQTTNGLLFKSCTSLFFYFSVTSALSRRCVFWHWIWISGERSRVKLISRLGRATLSRLVLPV